MTPLLMANESDALVRSAPHHPSDSQSLAPASLHPPIWDSVNKVTSQRGLQQVMRPRFSSVLVVPSLDGRREHLNARRGNACLTSSRRLPDTPSTFLRYSSGTVWEAPPTPLAAPRTTLAAPPTAFAAPTTPPPYLRGPTPILSGSAPALEVTLIKQRHGINNEQHGARRSNEHNVSRQRTTIHT